MHIHLLSKLHVSDSNVVCSEGDADLPHVGPDVSTDAVLQRLVYNCYKRKTNLIGLTFIGALSVAVLCIILDKIQMCIIIYFKILWCKVKHRKR